MLKTIGRRPAGEDPASRLAECHVRIRHHLAVARRLVAAQVDAAQIGEAAEVVRKYFVSSFALHQRDEDEVVFPWLTGRDPAIDAVIATLTADHAQQELAVSQLVRICRDIAHEPHRLDEQREGLAAGLDALEPGLLGHLALEEEKVFPVLRALDGSEQELLDRAMRRAR